MTEVEMFGAAQEAVAQVEALPGVRSAMVEERGHVQVLVVRAEPGEEVTQQVLASLGDVPLGRVATRQPSLEDAYVELVAAADHG